MCCLFAHFRPAFEKVLTDAQLEACELTFVRSYLDTEMMEEIRIQSPASWRLPILGWLWCCRGDPGAQLGPAESQLGSTESWDGQGRCKAPKIRDQVQGVPAWRWKLSEGRSGSTCRNAWETAWGSTCCNQCHARVQLPSPRSFRMWPWNDILWGINPSLCSWEGSGWEQVSQDLLAQFFNLGVWWLEEHSDSCEGVCWFDRSITSKHMLGPCMPDCWWIWQRMWWGWNCEYSCQDDGTFEDARAPTRAAWSHCDVWPFKLSTTVIPTWCTQVFHVQSLVTCRKKVIMSVCLPSLQLGNDRWLHPPRTSRCRWIQWGITSTLGVTSRLLQESWICPKPAGESNGCQAFLCHLHGYRAFCLVLALMAQWAAASLTPLPMTTAWLKPSCGCPPTQSCHQCFVSALLGRGQYSWSKWCQQEGRCGESCELALCRPEEAASG